MYQNMSVQKMTTTIKKIALTLLLISFASVSFALDLSQAKSQGLVGEQPNGYLGAVTNNPEAKSLVADINGKRKASYQKVATKNQLSLEQVETLAGEKAIARTKTGHFVLINGQWKKK